jgi:hypothetical protein
MSRILFCPLIATLALVQAHAATPRDLAHSLPIVFEPNAGRWDPQVKFSARTDNYRVFLTARGAELSASQPSADHPRTVSISMLNANPQAEVSGADELRCQTSYFLGNRKENWRTGVPNYARVRYRAIYPGIDLVYYGANRELEYDFVVGPGADPSRIRLQFRGIERISVTPDGDLLVEAGGTKLVEKRPAVYQEQAGSVRRRIAGRFKLLRRNVVGFEVASYDHAQPLTIDPVLTYGTLLGGSQADSVIGVKMDRSGMIYVAGYMTTGDFGGGPGVYQAATTGSPNIFIAKINPAAVGADSLVYFTYIGGTGADMPYAMQLDAAGNIYLTGSTTSLDFPLGGIPALSTNAGGASDAFILKFNPALDGTSALVFSTYLGGTDLDIGYAIDVDQQGFIYVTGTTRSSDFPLTATAYAAILYGPSDAFIVKVDPSIGAFAYSSYLGGESTDQGRAIAVTPSGMVYFAGDTVSTMFPLGGNPYMPTPFGGGDIFLAQMDLTRSGVDSLLYSTYLGGSGLDAVRKMIIDSSGKLLLTGYTLSPDLPVTQGALQSTLNGIANVFVTRLDVAAPDTNIITYSTYFGGTGGDVAYDIATDSSGNIYLTGYTNSTDFPVTPDALQGKSGGGFDVFVSKLNLGGPGPGSVVYSTYTGQTSINVGYGIAVSPSGAIAVGGQSGSQDELPSVNVTDNAVQPVFAGGQSDGFVLFLSTAPTGSGIGPATDRK